MSAMQRNQDKKQSMTSGGSRAFNRRVGDAIARLGKAGWSESAIEAPITTDGVSVVRVSPAGDPRLTVVVGRGESPALPASLGYSSESRFLVYWGEEEVFLGQPHRWRASPGDSPGIVGDATDDWVLDDIFALSAPAKLLGGEVGLISMTGAAHDSLAIQLGNALAELRRQSAEVCADFEGDFDKPLLRFFHQLLFIRVQEDRGARQGVSIREIYLQYPDDSLVDGIEALLGGYRETLNSELFMPAGFPFATVGAKPLRALLRSLVEPWEKLNLNFSLSRADLAGRLYQQYMKQTPALERAGEGARPRLLTVAVQEDTQESTAAYYTPISLARVLARDTLGAWLERNKPKTADDVRVLDPACGSGSFLVSGFTCISDYFGSVRGRTLRRNEREAILRQSIYGADVDAKAIDISKVQLLEAAGLTNTRLPHLDDNLYVGDSLGPTGDSHAQERAHKIGDVPSVPWSELMSRTGGFDAILMNPPFGAQLRLPGRYPDDYRAALRDRFPEVTGWGSDLAYYFISLAFSLMRQSACAGFIVPRTLLGGKSGKSTREHISTLGRPSRIVDFRGLALFPGALAYTAMLEFVPGSRATELVDVAGSGVDPAIVLGHLSERKNHVVRRARINPDQLKSTWTPFSLELHALADKELGCGWRPLADVGDITVRQGTQSGSQKAFTIGEDQWHSPGDGLVEILGHPVKARYAPLVAWAKDISPLLAPARRERLFLPFEDDGQQSDDPEVQAILQALGGFKSRPQPGAIAVLRAPKVILRGFGLEPAAFADTAGDWVTVKGTKGGLAFGVARSTDDLLLATSGLLCSSLYQWLLRGLGQPRHDGSVEILQSQAEQLPWPDLKRDEWMEVAVASQRVKDTVSDTPGPERALGYRAAREQLDDVVFDVLLVGEQLRDRVRSELVRYV